MAGLLTRTVVRRTQDLADFQYWPALRVRVRSAEHVEEDGLGEVVEVGEGLAALGAQLIRLIQHLRDPPLLLQRWQRQLESCYKRLRNSTLTSAAGHPTFTKPTNP